MLGNQMSHSVKLAGVENTKILITEDVHTLAQQYKFQLNAMGCREIYLASSVMDAFLFTEQLTFDMAIVDVGLPDGSGFDVIDQLLLKSPDCVIVVISGEDVINMAAAAAHAGAQDYLQKPFTAERLGVTLRNTLETLRLRTQLNQWNLRSEDRFYGFVGRDERMQAVYRNIRTISGSLAPVYIHGESGTGKDLAAEAIYKTSSRSQGPFVPINCASIPSELIESELFGHVRGAFTGAHTDRDGAFILADGGTLFLDEIADLDLKVQAKLLRVLQTGELRRLGDSKSQMVDIRVISASHRNLLEMVRLGEFREDLFFRLHVVPLHLPALRDRGSDVLLLAHYFLKIYAKQENKDLDGFTHNAQALLLRHPWVGNVRELINTIRAVVALNSGDLVDASMMPAGFMPTSAQETIAQKTTDITPLAELERREIERALQLFGQNVALAAAALQIHPSTLHRKLKNYQVTV